MNTVDAYIAELAARLHARGGARRRFLCECRDHLTDAGAESGDGEAIRAFGPPSEVAAAFDAEVAAGRGVRSTRMAVAGVLATGGSTMALIHGAAPVASAPTGWAIAFFVTAQLAGVAAGLALLQALALRRRPTTAAELMLLGRRNGCALAAAGLAMFSAGAALPGHASAAVLLAGPATVCVAAVSVLRARSLARRLERATESVVRPPLQDLGLLLRVDVPPLDAAGSLAIAVTVGAAAAFMRDRAEHATWFGALLTGGIEAVAVTVCFVALGRVLGLRSRLRLPPNACGAAR